MTIAQWKAEIEKLEKSLSADQIKACEIVADDCESDSYLILYLFALRCVDNPGVANMRADYELSRDLRACLESIFDHITERREKEADYRDGTSG